MFDTPLVLAYRAGVPDVISFFAAWTASSRIVAMGTATALAVLAGSIDPRDWKQRFDFLENSFVFPLGVKVSERAEWVVMGLPIPTELTADDALVAATALIHDLPVYSLDPDRYSAVPGLTALPAH